MSRGTALIWFRRDLRLSDNPALRRAVDESDTIVPVFIHDDEEGEWAHGSASRWWLHHSLAALDEALRQKGSRLVIRRGDPLAVLRELAGDTGADAVHWNRLYDPHLVQRDTRVKEGLAESGIRGRSEKAALLLEPWEIATGSGDPYRVFTPFWRRAKQELPPPETHEAPHTARPPDTWPASLDLGELGYLPRIDWAGGFREQWTPGEAGARQRLETFADGALRDYDETRDIPAVDGVSRLSPHLHFGEISPRHAWHRIATRAEDYPDGTEAWLRELGWREFAHHVLYHFPRTTDEPLYEKYRDFPWREDGEDMLEAWQRGRTGIPIVDAGMRELWHTGWMHNRVRMIVASLLVKNIRLHWLEGARWFWDTLVDADLANNTMGWQWSAGCGADAAPYFRIFNPVRQGERFDGDGSYVRRWVPELEHVPDRYVHEPWKLPADEARRIGFTLGRDYPRPIVDLKQSRKEALEALKSV
ncbi:cryptochrome/photolyase family protein [Lentisalinibacter sediminis]|uniref:cryptochrome/photolyase family protein n=1 Tax=Lentisalinibacter sediminis TaxID=2992237 RepID=UPI0038662E24